MVTGASTICTFDSSISSSRALWQSSRTAGSGIGLQDRSCEIALGRVSRSVCLLAVSRGLAVSPALAPALAPHRPLPLNLRPEEHLLVEITHSGRNRDSRDSRSAAVGGEEEEEQRASGSGDVVREPQP